MSMICSLLGLSARQIAAVKATPSLIQHVIVLSQPDLFAGSIADAFPQLPPERRAAMEAARQAAKTEMQGYIAEAHAKLDPYGPFQKALDLQKSWHMLHYLFTGHVDASSAPGDALMTGEDIGDDVGYGPARLHSPEATQDFDRFLATVDVARLQQRVNYREMSSLGIYAMPMGGGSDADYEREVRAEVAIYFPKLEDYVQKTAATGNGLLIWLS